MLFSIRWKLGICIRYHYYSYSGINVQINTGRKFRSLTQETFKNLKFGSMRDNNVVKVVYCFKKVVTNHFEPVGTFGILRGGSIIPKWLSHEAELNPNWLLQKMAWNRISASSYCKKITWQPCSIYEAALFRVLFSIIFTSIGTVIQLLRGQQAWRRSR